MIVTNSSNTSTRRKRRKTGSQWVMRFPFIRARMKICGSSTQEYQDILIIKYQHFPCFNHILRLIGSLRRELNRRRIIRNVFWCPRIQEMFYRSHARHLQSSTIRNHQKWILTVFFSVNLSRCKVHWDDPWHLKIRTSVWKILHPLVETFADIGRRFMSPIHQK